ncbi:MAG: rod shape-determining protein MreC [Pseudomonadota bacterium]
MARQSNIGSRKRPMRGLGLAVIFVVAFVLVLFQTAPRFAAGLNPIRTTTSDQLAARSGSGWIARLSGRVARDERVSDLEAEVRDLARWRAAAISMAERMETYEAILNVQGEPPARGVTARIVSETGGPFAETLLANAGKSNGVEDGFIAVNDAGLVGRVIQLGDRSSRILKLSDFNSRIPVLGEASGVRGIMYGGREGWGTVADRPEADAFYPGERILTSGEGGVFPRGLLAGHAERRGNDWRVRFAMLEGQDGFVRLVPPAIIPKPEDNPVVEEELEEDVEATEIAQTASGARLAGQ